MIENLFIKFLQKFCFDLLELNINMNIFDLFKKIFTISMFLSFIFIIIYGIYNKFYKNYSIRGYYFEYKNNFFMLFLIYIINLISLQFLDDLLTTHLSKYKDIFKEETIFSTIGLIMFTIMYVILIFRQINETIEFLFLLLIQPFFIFDKNKLKKLKQKNLNIILNSCFLSLTYIILNNISNLTSILFLVILFFVLEFKTNIFFDKLTLSEYKEK